MINGILLTTSVITESMQGVIKKIYTDKNKGNGIFTFSAFTALASCLFFVITGGSMTFSPEVLPYSLGFAASYCIGMIFCLLSIKHGTLSFTALITSYSLVIPTFFSLAFLGESASVFFAVGFVLLVISLFFINGKSGKIKITPKWILYIILAFIGYGGCATIQTVQQRVFGGEYKNEFMTLALASVTVVFFIITLATERQTFVPSLRHAPLLSLLCGTANGATNYIVMVLVTSMQASIVFPVISGGGIIITWIVSKLIYKENLTAKQNIALVLGIISVVLMNL